MSRYYCGPFGVAIDDTEGVRCTECHRPWDAHREIPADQCGYFARCPDGDHGHHCTLTPGHAGRHETPGCGGAR